MITAVLKATKASKLHARNPKLMFILQSRFKVPVSMVLLYENGRCCTMGMRQSALLAGWTTKFGDLPRRACRFCSANTTAHGRFQRGRVVASGVIACNGKPWQANIVGRAQQSRRAGKGGA